MAKMSDKLLLTARVPFQYKDPISKDRDLHNKDNKISWPCYFYNGHPKEDRVIMPSSHLNHQVRQWCGVQNGQKMNRIIRDRRNGYPIVRNVILALLDKWLSFNTRADNNCTNELYWPRTSTHLVSDKCWCHVTCPKDECFSNFVATCGYIRK